MRMIVNLMLFSIGFAGLIPASEPKCCTANCGFCTFELCGEGHECENILFNNCCAEEKKLNVTETHPAYEQPTYEQPTEG